MTTSDIGRRAFLRGTGLAFGAIAVSAAVGTSLAGCSTSATTGGTIAAGAVPLPKYVPIRKAVADLPPIAPTGTCGYLSYPKKLFTSVHGAVLDKGSSVSAMVPISTAPAVARPGNLMQQLVEKELGGQVNMNVVTQSDYLAKFNTTIAGGDLPDMVFFQPVVGYAALLESKFQDLTPFLSGSNVAKYPNLANIPSAIWQAAAVGDKLYGIPIPRNGMNGLGLYHKEMFDEVGGYPKTADELLDVMKGLTRPSEKRWAYVTNSNSAYGLSLFTQIFGVPNKWKLEKGNKLVADIETEEYKAALEFAAKAFKAGVYHPNSNAPSTQIKNLFNNGQAAMCDDTVTALLGAWKSAPSVNKAANPQAITAFSHNGKGEPSVFENALTKQFVMLKKAPKKRIEELLRLANFIAAPLGSTEYELMTFGKEGQTFDFNADGLPILRQQYSNQLLQWQAIAAPPMEFFEPESPKSVKARYYGTKALSPQLVADPTAAYYSNTAAQLGNSLTQAVSDACASIISGKQPMSSFASAVATWKSGGGDAMRHEYEDAIAKATKGASK